MSLLYRLARSPLFGLPPETAHEVVTGGLEAALSTAVARAAARAMLEVRDPALRVRCWGLEFPNPVGLAAGFDKNGSFINALGALGFGFIEIGTVTSEPQRGNPRPRLFRLPEDGALLNRMGFNNAGAAAVARRLGRARVEPLLGINIGKSKVTPLEEATADYLRSLNLLLPHARYVVVNVSSPNTPGLRSLQETAPLQRLLRAVVARARERAGAGPAVPVLVKIAPDLSDAQAERAVEIALEEGISGIVAVNTTVDRTGLRTPSPRVEGMGLGGISGRPLRERAQAMVARIHARTGGTVPIIGVGGIFTADDAWARIRAGASLLQLYTGFIYQGPTIARDINRGLVERMRREGVRSVEELVGTGERGS